jgi:hypothetical protein
VNAVAVRPALFCVIADRHRDLAVAENACAGRFTHCGVTLELGFPPNWSAAELAHDAEWRVECSKFLWGLDLAHAFATAGEHRFAEAWEVLVRSWIEQVPPRADATEVAARRLQNWVYALQTIDISLAYKSALLDRMADEVAHVRGGLTPRGNHRTLELYGLLVAALGVPELDLDGRLADFAFDALAENAASEFHTDGVHREASTHYHMLVLRSLLGALENARRFGYDLGRDYEARLERACEFARHVHRPDRQIPALSDADNGDHGDLLELGARLLHRPDLAPGGHPRARLASFPYGGYFVQRSGWDRAARFLVFDCGPLGDGGHGHYDALSIEIAAGGAPLIVDPGRFTYAEGEPNLRRWFKGTTAHNTVTVEGLDQTPYRRGKPKRPVAEAAAGVRTTRPGLDVLRGAVYSPAYDAVHTRTIVFLDDAYWIVEDRLAAPAVHRYDLRFHLASSEARVRGDAVSAPGVRIVVAGADRVTLEPGWIAPEYGVRHPAAVVSGVRTAAEAVFTTLVFPAEDAAVGLRVNGPGRAAVVTRLGCDLVWWSHADAGWVRT